MLWRDDESPLTTHSCARVCSSCFSDPIGSGSFTTVSDLERVFEALNQHGVRFVTVGGVAVVLHGHLRTTADLDLVVELTRENALAAIEALEGLGFQPRAPVAAALFADPAKRQEWAAEKGMTVFSLWSSELPGFEIDLFIEEPFDFSEVFARALRISLGSSETTVAAIEDLIKLKEKSGRLQDLADIEALKALKDE